MLVRVLVAMDTADRRQRVRRMLARAGTVTLEARSRRDLWAQLTHEDVDIVVCGRALLPAVPDAMIASIRDVPERPDLIVISEREDPAERAGLLAAGSLGVLNEGLPDAAISEALYALVSRRREADIRAGRAGRDAQGRGRLSDFVSESASMREFMTVASRVVDTQSPLLVLGETGVGKERLARSIHADGPRTAGPFVPVNCGAIAEGLLDAELFGHELGAFTGATRSRKGFFELAHGGTLFLDEIGELPLHLQVKLLRVLEERTVRRVGSERTVPIDVRVIAATNRHIEHEVAERRFRADLYYRLAVVTLVVPPLRDRREDIPSLVTSYLDHFRAEVGRPVTGIEAAAMERLIAYAWPGNVRELINVIERAVLLARGGTIGLADLPQSVARAHRGHGDRSSRDTMGPDAVTRFPIQLAHMPLREARRQATAAFETAYLSELLRRTGGRVGLAANLAGVDPRSIHTLMKRRAIAKEEFKPVPRSPKSEE